MPTGERLFVSYNREDANWAGWIAWVLREHGCDVRMQAWNFRTGHNFVKEIDEALTEGRRVVALLSPSYLTSEWCYAEWSAAFNSDPDGSRRVLLPFRVRDCSPTPLFRTRVYTDLFGLPKSEALSRMLEAINPVSDCGTTEPPFPESLTASNPVASTALLPAENPPAFPLDLSETFYLPRPRNPHYVPHANVLERIRDALVATQSAALCGTPGLGKTQTALEYCHSHATAYDAVLWVNCENGPALGLAEIAEWLGLSDGEESQPERAAAVIRWLRQRQRWLLVYDNADDMAPLLPFLPPTAADKHLLITTRIPHAGGIAQDAGLPPMTGDLAATFLLKRAGLNVLDVEARRHALTIAEEIDGLPLALDQAGAFIAMCGTPLEDFLPLYRERRASILADRGDLDLGHPSVAVTVQLALEVIEKQSPATGQLLRFCSYLNPSGISESLLQERAASKSLPAELCPVVLDRLLWERTLSPALRQSIMARIGYPPQLSQHRVISDAIRLSLSQEQQKEYALRAIEWLSKICPTAIYDHWPMLSALVPHITRLWEVLPAEVRRVDPLASLLDRAGWLLKERGAYEQADVMLKSALAIAKRLHGTRHRMTAAITFHHAKLLDAQGNLPQAEVALRAVIDMRSKLDGREHERTIKCWNELAYLVRRRGRLGEAEKIWRWVLSVRERQLGINHPDVAENLSHLAFVLAMQGNANEAEVLYRRSVDICERCKSPNPRRRVQMHYNFGFFLESQDKLDVAEAEYRSALSLAEKNLGPTSKKTIPVRTSLGYILQKQGRNAEAVEMFRTTAANCESCFGVNHPIHIRVQSNFADVLARMRRLPEAREMAEETLTRCLGTIGDSHLATALCLRILGLISHQQGDNERAAAALRQALGIYEAKMGPDHAETALCMHYLACALSTSGSYDEARVLFEGATEIVQRSGLGGHPAYRKILQDNPESTDGGLPKQDPCALPIPAPQHRLNNE